VLFSGGIFGSRYCDHRLFDSRCGDFRFAFDYSFVNIMGPFERHVLPALDLLEPLAPRIIARAHGPILRERPGRYLARYRDWSAPAS
jgi:flavorubredoxin